MPYVLQERRPALDKIVDELVKIDLKKGELELFLLNIARNYNTRFLMSIERNIKEAVNKADEIEIKPNGDVNYILFKYCKYHIKPSYNNYKAFMGEIYNAMNNTANDYKDEYREAAEWIRIKILTPYEEKAIERNGDV